MTKFDILDPSALISLLPTLLPPSCKLLKTPQDAISALLHSMFSTVGFRLIAVDETSSSNTTIGNILPDQWDKDSPGHYSFRYKHDQSSLEFILKVTKLGSRTLINAIATESDKVTSLDISTNDFVSPSFFPHALDSESNGQPLIHGFISSNRVIDFTSQVKLKILQNLIPGLRKDGYIEEATSSSSNATGSNLPQAQTPAPARPRSSTPPYTPENNYRPPHLPPDHPLQVGRRDLDPFPSNLFRPPPLFPNNDDGMFVGPEHPIFGIGRERNPFGVSGPWGGDGYLPPMGAPPGARFDPIGPGSRRGRGEFRNLGRGRGRHLGSPDNDEFMPPGMGDMFL